MRRLKIDQVAVVDDRNLLCGRLRMRDLIAFAATSMLGDADDADGRTSASDDDDDDAAGEGGWSGQNANRWNTVLDVCGEEEGEEESGCGFDMRPGRGDVAGDVFVLTPRVQRDSNTANDGNGVKERGHELPRYAATNTTSSSTGTRATAAPSMLARNAAHYTCKKTDSVREILEKFQRWDLTTMEVVGADGMLTGQLHVDDLLATLLNGTLELLPAEKRAVVVDSGVQKESLVRR